MTKLIAIDFDHTLTLDSGDPFKVGGETPNRKMVRFVQSLKEDKNYDIIIWTARPWSHASHIAGLLTMWEVPFNGLMMGKGGADLYLDDKAVNHLSDEWEAWFDDVLAGYQYQNIDNDQSRLTEVVPESTASD